MLLVITKLKFVKNHLPSNYICINSKDHSCKQKHRVECETQYNFFDVTNI